MGSRDGQRFAIHSVTCQLGPSACQHSRSLLKFAPYQSAFIVFRKNQSSGLFAAARPRENFDPLADLAGPWEVSFDPAWGGPEKIVFDKLDDWTQRPEEGIRHYSGKAVYRKRLTFPRKC